VGFQDMPRVVHEAASRKGGRVRKPKGLAKQSLERRKEIASLGGKTSADNRRKGTKQTQVGESRNTSNLADVLGALDE